MALLLGRSTIRIMFGTIQIVDGVVYTTNVVLHTASPQWWLVGWVLSIFMLVVGYAIGFVYYGDEPEAESETEEVNVT